VKKIETIKALVCEFVMKKLMEFCDFADFLQNFHSWFGFGAKLYVRRKQKVFFI